MSGGDSAMGKARANFDQITGLPSPARFRRRAHSSTRQERVDLELSDPLPGRGACMRGVFPAASLPIPFPPRFPPQAALLRLNGTGLAVI